MLVKSTLGAGLIGDEALHFLPIISMPVVLTNSICLDFQGQPKPQNMAYILGEHQFILLENFETIYISSNWTGPFMSQSFIAGSAILCHFMPNDQSLWGLSLIPSIPPQKHLCRLRLALYTRHKAHMSCFRIETYLLRRHTPIAHRIGGNRERSLIFRKIVNGCQIKRFRLPKRQSTNSNKTFSSAIISILAIENVDFGNRKRKIPFNSAFTIAAYPV